jgi:aminoglycoside phosphotransferase (APT) family kinase protein
MTGQMEALSGAAAADVLNRLSPGSTLVEAASLDEGSNSTWLVTGQAADGTPLKIVVRRYAVFGDYDRGEKARREYRLFQLLWRSAVPVPQPLLLDETGDILGSPGIVTQFVSGDKNTTPDNPLPWAGTIARTLVDIHRISWDVPEIDFLLDGNAEALWFLKYETPPDYIASHPRGADAVAALRRLLPSLEPVPACLVHIDYWSGQFLWDNHHIVAVVDWEEVAHGDPAIDVAYCRMDMFLNGLPEAGDEFLRIYEEAAERKVANLGFWGLAAAIRPMFSGYGLESPTRERLSDFIEDALRLGDL